MGFFQCGWSARPARCAHRSTSLPGCMCSISCSAGEVLQHQYHQSTLHCFISCSFLHCQSLLLLWPSSVASLSSTQQFSTPKSPSKWTNLKTHCRLLRRAKRTIIKSRLNLSWIKFNPKWKSLSLAKEAEGKKSWSCKKPSSLPLSQFGKEGTTTSLPPGRILKEDELLSKFYSKQLLIRPSTSFPASPAFRA